MTRILPASLALAATACLIVPMATFAQTQLGAKAGFAITNFLGDSDPEFETKTNFAGGLTIRTDLNRNLAVQPEVLYMVKGSRTTTVLNGVNSNLSFTVTYIEVPVMLRYSFSPRSTVSPTAAAGPVVSFNIDSRVKYGAVDGELEFTDSDDSIKSTDFGVAAELGADFRWDLRTISVGARYTYGVSNIIDNPDDPKHNGAFSLMAGIAL